jgi:hypothetical protein
MKKQKLDSANQQEVVSTETANENTANASTEAVSKSLDDYKKEFDRLNLLFSKKRRFENAMQRLLAFETEVNDEPTEEIESKEFKLVFASGTYNDKEAIKVTNIAVIKETITYMKAKIENQILFIEAEILQA